MRSASQLSTERVESLSMGMQRPAALYDFFVFLVGVSRTLLQGFIVQAPFCLQSDDVKVSEDLLDELPIVIGTASFCTLIYERKPGKNSTVTPSRSAGSHVPPVIRDAWLALCALAKEREKYARLN